MCWIASLGGIAARKFAVWIDCGNRKLLPEIAGFSNITKEMEDLQEALQAIGKVRIS